MPITEPSMDGAGAIPPSGHTSTATRCRKRISSPSRQTPRGSAASKRKRVDFVPPPNMDIDPVPTEDFTRPTDSDLDVVECKELEPDIKNEEAETRRSELQVNDKSFLFCTTEY